LSSTKATGLRAKNKIGCQSVSVASYKL